MSTISAQQAITYAKNAGFTGTSLAIIVAIATAESGLQTDIRGKTDSRDRGILQINSYWHPEVSDQCAFDPQCAFQAAYRISSNGNNFSQWTTYQNGAYKQYMSNNKPCPADCNIPTGIPGLTINAPGADCSSCSQSPDNYAIQQAPSALTNAATNSLLQPVLQSLPTIGIKVGLFMFALMLVIVGMWVLVEGGNT